VIFKIPKTKLETHTSTLIASCGITNSSVITLDVGGSCLGLVLKNPSVLRGYNSKIAQTSAEVINYNL